ncbi:MAG TPA: hypothetical protein VEI02_14975 [Planctomycetota bacterium]|nr:hypothetical protein [Planctomycetota bacterium]
MSPAEEAVRRVRRGLRRALFVSGAAAGFAVVATLGGAALLAARLLGHAAPPSPWWLVAAAIPAVAGWRRARAVPEPRALAAWMDRKAGLGGLLAAAAETDAGAWAPELERRLQVDSPAPKLRRRPLALRTLLPAAFLAAALATPSASVAPRDVRLLRAVAAETRRALAEAEAMRKADPRTLEALRARLDTVEKDLDDRGGAAWADLDRVREALEHATRLAEDAREVARGGLEAFAAAPIGDASEAATALDALIARAEAAGALERLSAADRAAVEAHRERLREARADRGSRPHDAGAAADAAALRATAEDLARMLAEDAARDDGDDGDPGDADEHDDGLADDDAFDDVDHVHDASCAGGACSRPATRAGRRSVADGSRPQGKAKKSRRESGGAIHESPGSGGVSRGPGAAPLRLRGETPESPAELEARRLPSNAEASKRWTLEGVVKAEPAAAPVEDASPGREGVDAEGDAAWRRRIPPRHRAAVKRYFADPKTGERR